MGDNQTVALKAAFQESFVNEVEVPEGPDQVAVASRRDGENELQRSAVLIHVWRLPYRESMDRTLMAEFAT